MKTRAYPPLVLAALSVAFCAGCTNSYYVRDVAGNGTVATPVLTPPGGSYSSPQQVMIADATSGASIYYTTNGTTPTTASTLYTSAITVASSETIEAIAVAPGYADSGVGLAVYVVAGPVVATPVFSPPGGTYPSAQQVTIADATPGASIYYTTNGSTPTSTSTPYTGAIAVSATETIQAIAIASGYQNSAIGPAAYIIAGSSPSVDEWTWMSGGETDLAQGVYGTLGVAAPSNVPGAREDNATWTDSSGNLWLFGGLGIDSAGNTNELNDLWKFNPLTNQWTWISGSNAVSAFGVYGGLGVASPTNVPGARIPCASWVDNNGKFWLFGGVGSDSRQSNGALDDLWMFDPVTSMWTWEGGYDALGAPGVYGTPGSSISIPGARISAAYWKDSAGSLWLFGGYGIDAVGNFNTLSDLWKFSPATKEWTFVRGSTTVNAPGIYGTQGTASFTGMPGARQYSIGWADSTGNFWLFGGETSTAFALLNDLWQFNPTTGEWTWVSGSSTTGSTGSYGTKGLASAGNTPGDRYGGTGWADSKGRIYLFGGTGDSAIGNFSLGSFNDIWRFDTSTGLWTWINGSDAPEASPSYGIEGVPSASNVPGSRYFITGWTDAASQFWVLGGTSAVRGGSGLTNDLWRYQP